jgi:hypothetical protein
MILEKKTLEDLHIDINTLSIGSNCLVYCACQKCNKIALLRYRHAIKRKYCNQCKYLVRKERIRVCVDCGKIKPEDNPQWCGKHCPSCYTKKWKQETGKKYKRNYSPEQKRQNADRERNYRKNHKEKVKERQRKWRKNSPKFREHNRTYRRNYQRYSRSLEQRLRDSLRGRLNSALKGNYKSGSAVRDLGCTITELKLHLESHFLPGMSWDNWGKYGWHIDHIIPLSSFDLTNPEQLKKACHYTNLQPLWWLDNIRKSDSLVEEAKILAKEKLNLDLNQGG